MDVGCASDDRRVAIQKLCASSMTPTPHTQKKVFLERHTGPLRSVAWKSGATVGSVLVVPVHEARVSGVVLGKRPRLCGSTANGRDVTGRSQSPARPLENSTSHSPKDAASTPEKVERMLAAPELHRNGGGAAKEAATAVLFQRGLVEFKPLADHLDRRKLTSFFSLKTQKPTSTQATTVIDLDGTAAKTGLAAWKAQPWKKDEDGASSNPFRVTSNALSMEASRPKNMWKKY